jgi:hypothetical protein
MAPLFDALCDPDQYLLRHVEGNFAVMIGENESTAHTGGGDGILYLAFRFFSIPMPHGEAIQTAQDGQLMAVMQSFA